jgi:oligopeptidase B
MKNLPPACLAVVGCLVAVFFETTPMNAKEPAPKPPSARKIPTVHKIHGYEEVDPYAWLRDDSRQSKAVLKHLKAENTYAERVTASLSGFEAKLYAEMLERIKEDDTQVPGKRGDHYYYHRTEAGKQYPIRCRKRGDVSAEEEVTLDENQLAEGHQFFSLGDYAVSLDGNLLAYTTDVLGYRQYQLHVKDLRTGKTVENIAARVTSVVWAADNNTLFYVQENPTTKRSEELFRHVLGSEKHESLYVEDDELYAVEVTRTRSDAFICLVIQSRTTSEVRYLSATKPGSELKLFLPRKEGHEYYIDHSGSDFFVRTNDRGKTFRLARAPVDDPRQESWREMIPVRADVMLEDVDCFANHLVAVERHRGVPRFTVHDLASGVERPVTFPEPVYLAHPVQNYEFDTHLYRFSYQSLLTPNSVYDYDVRSGTRELKKKQPVLGGYDPTMYTSERVEATSADGVKVPVSLVYRKDVPRDGSHPMLLEAYGSYGFPYDVDFSSERLSLLNRGVVCAMAHIRGGGDLGKDWHDQGKMLHKKNTFTDFIACAEFLVAEKYTSRDRLAITGGSAGGLLMGAVTNMRPDLFHLVVSYVPFVDVLNTMLDESLPLTVGEYLEWGNPNEKKAYDYMRSYSPYENIERKAYPTMLVRTSLHDSQVGYWEPAKYVARLREFKTDKNLLLFRTKLEPGGHGGASGRYDRLKDTAFDYAFILSQFGIKE